ncbi:unnamed protein product [Camellia sinensis]
MAKRLGRGLLEVGEWRGRVERLGKEVVEDKRVAREGCGVGKGLLESGFSSSYWHCSVYIMSLSLFRFVAVGRKLVVVCTLGTCTLIMNILLRGFIVAQNDIEPFMIWGYYISPVMYGQNALVINEFLDKRWSAPNPDPRIHAPTVAKVLLKSRDIDAADVDNELAVVKYVEGIYKFYKLTEDESQVHNYMDSQPEINSKMRSILIDWLTEVHRKFELMLETLYLTVNIVARYLSVNVVPRRELQLVGISSMLIACKYKEIWALEFSQLYGEILEENGIDLAEMKVLRRKMEEIAIAVNQGSTTT